MSKITTKAPSLVDLAMKYDSREKCLDLLESLRWPDGPACPRCGHSEAYRIHERRLYECKSCRHQYSATSGTVMHNTRLSLTKWIMGAALLANARKGVSACQMARDLHVTYKTAWYLGHRLRRAMRESEWLKKFSGVVEVDETYLGGKARGGKRGRGAGNKTPVFGARERNGKVRLNAVPNVSYKALRQSLHQYVSPDAKMVVADEWPSYNQLAAEFTMARINHQREYVRGIVHTQGIESVWAIVKRQFHGTHHKMSQKYLPLYLSEIDYRFNHRKEPGLFRSILANALQTDDQVVIMAAPNGKETHG